MRTSVRRNPAGGGSGDEALDASGGVARVAEASCSRWLTWSCSTKLTSELLAEAGEVGAERIAITPELNDVHPRLASFEAGDVLLGNFQTLSQIAL